MEKIKEFLKNKSIGYFIVIGVALLSLILAIIFFATYSNPALDPIGHHNPMGNKAEGLVVETIGIFLLAGFIVELVVLVVPQYRFVQVVAVVMFGLAFYKDLLVIPDFFAGIANNVMYNGGNLGLNMFYFITLILILIASIVPAFMGFYKKEEEANEDMKVNGTNKIIKVSASAVVLVAAVLASTFVAGNLTNMNAKHSGNQGQSSQPGSSEQAKPKKDPITDRIREAADAVEYSFNPDEVLIKEQEEYNFNASELSSLSHSMTRSGHNLVYVFEGVFSEGYQGGYGTYSASLYLWEDGLFTGKSNNDNFKGYWYNSSIDFGTNEEGEDIQDCLDMVTNSDKYKSIITDPIKGFYQRQGYVHLNPGWGARSVVVSGYRYYPDVAIFIDTDDIETFKVGSVFNRATDWSANRVIKNLTYTPIVNVNEVTWTYPSGMLDENDKFAAAGEYEIKAKWGSFEDSVTITVTEQSIILFK